MSDSCIIQYEPKQLLMTSAGRAAVAVQPVLKESPATRPFEKHDRIPLGASPLGYLTLWLRPPEII